MEPEQAFKEIGELMTGWAARLPVRDSEHNAAIKAQMEPILKRPFYDRSDKQRDDLERLQRSSLPLRSVAHLIKTSGTYKAVFEGSPRMDPGAPFMLLTSNAKPDEDGPVAADLLRLMELAKPGWKPDAILRMVLRPLLDQPAVLHSKVRP